MYKKILTVAAILIILAVFLVIFQKQPNNNNITPPQGILTPDEEQEVVFQDLFAPEAIEMIEQGTEFVIIDVSDKYDLGHLPGAINFYIMNGTLDSALNSLDKNQIYLVYGHSYRESVAGAQKMTNAGFETVYRLEGDYDGWLFEGYEIEN